MQHEGLFTVIVTFQTTPGTQQQALEEIGAYVESFLSRQPGFVRSTLHRGTDGESLAHYALWRSEADFRAAGEKAREHPAMPALRRFQPQGRYYEVAREFTGTGA